MRARMLLPLAVAILVACADAGAAASGNITTFAGGGAGDGGLASRTPLSNPHDGAFDAAGNYYFTETNGHRILRVSASGTITTIAGTGAQGNTGDGGNARQATLNQPQRIAVDNAGNVYFTDWGDHRVRRIDTSGIITVFAGNGSAGFSGDGGPASAASLNQPDGVAVDASGNVYIADALNWRVRKVSGGIITTVAGVGNQPCFAPGPPMTPLPNGDGGPASAAYVHPAALTLDGAGGYYLADICGIIRHVDGSGTITRVAGGGSTIASLTPVDAMSLNLTADTALSRDAAGNLYVGAFYFVVKIVPGGMATRFAGNGNFGDSGDGGPATSAQLNLPYGVTASPAGEVLITMPDTNRIRKVDLAGVISHFAGANGVAGDIGIGDGGPATSANLPTPAAIAKDAAGNIYIADGERVRKVDTGGNISTVLGGGTDPGVGIAGTSALGEAITGVAVDGSGNLFYTLESRHCVRKLDAGGVVRAVAGTCGVIGSGGDGGPATAATMSVPRALAFDALGNLYVLDAGNARIRKIDAAGNIAAFAGNGVAYTATGDGGPATAAGMTPSDMVLDSSGNLYVVDTNNNRVRKVDTAGIIRTIAGTGNSAFFSDGGPATSASLNGPGGIAIDADGNLFIADTRNQRIRMVDTQGVITTVAGIGPGSGTLLEGVAASSAQLFTPTRMTIGPGGALLFSEEGSQRVRRVEILDTTPDPFSFTASTGVALSTPQQSNTVVLSGFNTSLSIGVTNGEYSIGCSGTFVSTAGTVTAGQSVCVRHTSSVRNNDTVTTALSVGGRTGAFSSTTIAGAGSIAVSAPSLDFGAQSMNTTSPAQTLTLTNTGSVPVTVNAVTAGTGFGAASDCATLAPAAACTVTITFTPGTQGTIGATVVLQNSPGTQTVSVQGFGERSLTTHYYRAILRRAPDVAGKAFWENEATRMTGLGANINETWYAMANAFFSSPEYVAFNRSDAEFLVDLYKTFFNRAPDPGGNAFWGDQLASGVPRGIVLVSFMLSPEFRAFTQAIFGNTAARAEVDIVMDFYRGVLSRLPDQDGYAFWVQKLRTAQCGGNIAAAIINFEVDSISSQFLNSAEYLGRNRTNGQYVGDLYNAFLRRGGDPAGVRSWMNVLDGGTQTREQLRQAFLRSPEFQGRVRAVVLQGCLQ